MTAVGAAAAGTGAVTAAVGGAAGGATAGAVVFWVRLLAVGAAAGGSRPVEGAGTGTDEYTGEGT